MTSHLIIPDTQIRPGIPDSKLTHIAAAANYANYHEIDKIVILGDWWDMPSLSAYDKDRSMAREGRRISLDIEIGNEFMATFLDTLDYKPEIHFLYGNHEDRLTRLCRDNAEFDGCFDGAFYLEGVIVHPFLEILNLDGVHYSHYFANPYSGRPYGGSALNVLKHLGFSFTAGHKQILDVSRIDRNNKTAVQGLIAGAFYQHNESYKGPQGNHHWRGIIHKTSVVKGTYDLTTIQLSSLLEDYS